MSMSAGSSRVSSIPPVRHRLEGPEPFHGFRGFPMQTASITAFPGFTGTVQTPRRISTRYRPSDFAGMALSGDIVSRITRDRLITG